MVRSLRVGTLAAVLAGVVVVGVRGDSLPTPTATAQPERFITIKEDGKGMAKCRVLKCWTQADGCKACEVQVVETGEMMTIVDEAPKAARQRIFAWGKSKTTPAGAPPAPIDAQVVSSWSKTAAAEPAKDAVVPVARKVSSEPTTPEPIAPPALELPGVGAQLPEATTLTPTPEKAKVVPTPTTTSTACDCSTGSTCTSCDAGKPAGRRVFGGRDFQSSPRTGVLANLFNKNETVIEGTPDSKVVKTEVVKESRLGGLFKKHDVVETTVSKDAVVKTETPPGHSGPFARMTKPAPKAVAPTSKPAVADKNMPLGMASVHAAATAAHPEAKAVGALVRMPDGTHTVVPVSPYGSNFPSIAASSSNAFATPSASMGALAYNPGDPGRSNAFTMATPYRPVPADMSMPQQMPNAFLMGGGMPGAEQRPTMPAMAYYQPVMVPHPGMMMPAATAVATDRTASEPHVLALHQSLLPSEREKAAEALAKVNWRAEPQVVPALVMAAKSDPASKVRVACIRVLGEMKANSMPAVQALEAMKADGDPQVRHEVSKVLPALQKQ